MWRAVPVSLMALLGASTAAAEPWPIRTFEVVEVDADEVDDLPGGMISEALEAVRGVLDDDMAGPPERQDLREDIETYLGLVAAKLEAWGFPPPALSRVVELADGRRAYRVYMTDRGFAGVYRIHNVEGGRGGTLLLNRTLIAPRGRLRYAAHGTIAHELFHAVQNNTRFFSSRPAEVGEWIREGQASAVGNDLARVLRSGRRGPRDDDNWGLRRYDRHLAVAAFSEPPNDPAYATSSFWRYLAELDFRRRPPRSTVPPGIAFSPDQVHYGYLAYLLSREPVARDCNTEEDRCDSEVDWLNAGLLGYQHFQQSLRRLFSEFAVTVAAYGYDGGRASRSHGDFQWRDGTVTCHYVTLSRDARQDQASPRFHGISAGCVVVSLDGVGAEASIVVDASASDAARLNQIVFGVAGDVRSATPIITGKERASGVTRTSWSVRVSGGEPTALIFANVDPMAQNTRDQTLSVTVTLPGSDTSVSREAIPSQPGVAPTRRPTTPAGELRNDANGRLERAGPRLTSDGPASVNLQRRARQDRMRLRLNIVPDVLNVGLDVNDRMGGLGQALMYGQVGQAVAGSPSVATAARRLSEIDGARIDLTFPLIDYGFVGTFEDAEVFFSRSRGGRLEAIGPVDADPGPGRDMRPSGRVTIEEYTPEILRGSFHARLVDPRQNLKGLQPSYDVVRTVEGRFWVAAPWRQDERMEVGPSASMKQDATEDMVTIVPESPGASPPGGGTEPPAARPRQSGSGDVDRLPDECDCSCDAFKRLQALAAALSGRAPTPAEERLVVCSARCASRFASCVRQ